MGGDVESLPRKTRPEEIARQTHRKAAKRPEASFRRYLEAARLHVGKPAGENRRGAGAIAGDLRQQGGREVRQEG